MSKRFINMNADVQWTEADLKKGIITVAFKRGDYTFDSPEYVINIKVNEGFINSITRSINRAMVARIERALNHKKSVIDTISQGTGWKDEDSV